MGRDGGEPEEETGVERELVGLRGLRGLRGEQR